MKRVHTIITKVMSKRDRQSTYVHIVRVMLWAISALSILVSALLLFAGLPTWLRVTDVIVSALILIAAAVDVFNWYQKIYIPAREIYFYDRESWDES